jgi:uncharacterized membrane protein
MLLGTLVISGRDWLLPVAGLLGVGLLILFWGYSRAPVNRPLRVGCVLLKVIGLLALLACLLEPLWSGQRARPGANLFVILADNSQGMQIKDHGESRSRGEILHALLTADKNPWQSKLNDNFQVRNYLFDSRVQSTRDFSELIFDGRASSIGTALRTVADRYKGQPLAGVLLLTDGNATDIVDGSPDVSGLPPVYPIVMGRDDAIKDIAVQKVAVSQTAFEDAPVSIQADVTAAGYSGETIVAQVLEIVPPASTNLESAKSLEQKKSNAGKKPTAARDAKQVAEPVRAPGLPVPEKIVAEQTQRAPREGESMTFRFQMRPEKIGISFYRLRVAAKSEFDQFTNPKGSSEATLANNSRILVVDRGKGPYRILYVAGRPNWEYKFLNRAVAEDDQIQLVGLIRIAKREPKFDFRGRVGESSNPLFRGFGNQSKEEIERYDQPVLVRIYPNDEVKLREEVKLSTGFPKTAEELYDYHAVVLDDLESEFFTHDQMTLLQKFVSERGAGFLMLGGQESFGHGKYDRTPIGDMLPVYLDRIEEAKPSDTLKLSLTREGWLNPWVRLRNNETDENARLEAMPPFQVLNQVRDFKPGGSVIAKVADPSGKTYPALIVQRFGNGRTAALTIGDFWHWGLRDPEVHKDLDKAWRQMMRWLVADVPNRIELLAEQKRGDANQAIELQVRVRDQKFQPLDNASVTLRIQSIPSEAKPEKMSGGSDAFALTNAARLNAEPALVEPGLYQTTYIPRDTGGYKAEAVVTNSVGAEVGRAEVGWTSDPAAEEFRSLKPNRALLETIAKRTGGEVIALNRLEEFAASMPHRNVPVTENWSLPLWHRSSVFLFALACFVTEWGLRRWKGLA